LDTSPWNTIEPSTRAFEKTVSSITIRDSEESLFRGTSAGLDLDTRTLFVSSPRIGNSLKVGACRNWLAVPSDKLHIFKLAAHQGGTALWRDESEAQLKMPN
jgi:hypothetical protein